MSRQQLLLPRAVAAGAGGGAERVSPKGQSGPGALVHQQLKEN